MMQLILQHRMISAGVYKRYYIYYLVPLRNAITTIYNVQSALVSREIPNWLACNCVNFILYQPATPATTQGIK